MRPGETFVALKGERYDANEMVSEVLQGGAGLVITQNDEFRDHDRVIVVEDTLITLQELARFHRQKIGIEIIALTGSNGKTTTKELLNAFLSAEFDVGVTKGNLNNHIGVPLTLLSFNGDMDLGIVEMGANHQREIAALSEIARPDYGFITNIGMAHLEGFGGIEGVKKGKGELYEHLKKNEKLIFLNLDQEKLADLLGDYSRFISCTDRTLEYDGIKYEINPVVDHGLCGISLRGEAIEETVMTALVGIYNYRNIVIALLVAGYFKVPLFKALKVLRGFGMSLNRSQYLKRGGAHYVMDAYNANPTSMKAALDAFLVRESSSNKCVLLGDMLELGDLSAEAHEDILKRLMNADLDEVILVGHEFGIFKSKYPFKFFNDVDEAARYWKEQERQNWTILIKGSRGIHMERILSEI